VNIYERYGERTWIDFAGSYELKVKIFSMFYF